MGVEINEARRYDAAGRVDRLAGFLRNGADRDDPAIPDADIAPEARCAAAIDNRPADYPEIEHFPLLARCGLWRSPRWSAR